MIKNKLTCIQILTTVLWIWWTATKQWEAKDLATTSQQQQCQTTTNPAPSQSSHSTRKWQQPVCQWLKAEGGEGAAGLYCEADNGTGSNINKNNKRSATTHRDARVQWVQVNICYQWPQTDSSKLGRHLPVQPLSQTVQHQLLALQNPHRPLLFTRCYNGVYLSLLL